jgi:hypothetical protein
MKTINVLFFMKKEFRMFSEDEHSKLVEYGYFDGMYLTEGFVLGLPSLSFLANTTETIFPHTQEVFGQISTPLFCSKD